MTRTLIERLKSINPVWGDMTVRVAGESWGMPLIDQKTKALICIALDQMALNVTGDANPFGAHVDMALKQGVTYDELEELIVFATVYLVDWSGSKSGRLAAKVRVVIDFLAEKFASPVQDSLCYWDNI